MSGLICTALNQESTFPSGSREQGAIKGCPPQAGYHTVYSLFCRYHPLLHSVFSTASKIPRQHRTDSCSLYIRRLQDFMVRERQNTHTYTESEALDLSVRNLTSEWHSEFRRLVEREKHTGHDGALPFKLSLAQRVCLRDWPRSAFLIHVVRSFTNDHHPSHRHRFPRFLFRVGNDSRRRGN